MTLQIERPQANEHATFYSTYINRVTESNLLDILAHQPDEMRAMLGKLPVERGTYRYAPGKWSVAEVIGHLSDSERVFAYRTLCIARGDTTPLPGFDENTYVPASRCDQRGLPQVLDDFVAVRRATISLLQGLAATDLARIGNANGSPVSGRALAYIMAGHVRHHLGTLRERYGIGG